MQHQIYENYVERTTKNNIKPVETVRGDEAVFAILREQGVDFHKPYSFTTRYWDNDSRTRVFKFADGRLAEYATTNSAIGTPLLAIFESHDDWFGYSRPMGMFHYLYT